MPESQTQTDGRRTGYASGGSRVVRSTGRPRKGKYLKKTTRKGAYKKSNKRNFQKRRAPFVETKKQTDILVSLKSGNQTGNKIDELRMTTEPLQISFGTPAAPGVPADPKELTIFPLQSFMNMNQGLDESSMIGNTVYSRFLKCKFEFQLPFGGNQIRHPCDMFLIHGWVTQPIGNTFHTTPTMTDFTRANYNTHIQEQIEQYFNQRSDKLDYIPKKTSNIKIEGYRKLKVKKSHNLGPDPQAVVTVTGTGSSGELEAIGSQISNYGAHPVVNMTCNWRTKRKIHYIKGKEGVTPSPLDFFYPNYSWIPFVALYNPTAIEFLSSVTYPGTAAGTVKSPDMYVRYNSIHYFSDS